MKTRSSITIIVGVALAFFQTSTTQAQDPNYLRRRAAESRASADRMESTAGNIFSGKGGGSVSGFSAAAASRRLADHYEALADQIEANRRNGGGYGGGGVPMPQQQPSPQQQLMMLQQEMNRVQGIMNGAARDGQLAAQYMQAADIAQNAQAYGYYQQIRNGAAACIQEGRQRLAWLQQQARIIVGQ